MGAKGERGLIGERGERGSRGERGLPGPEGKAADETLVVEKVVSQVSAFLEERIPTEEELAGLVKTFLKKKISTKDINGLEEMLDDLRRKTSAFVRGGGDTVAAGTGITISQSEGVKTISVSGTGGFTVLTATGTRDDSNLIFTFTQEPTLVNVNGTFYRQTGGAITWSYLAGTVTLSSPVGINGDIYGIA